MQKLGFKSLEISNNTVFRIFQKKLPKPLPTAEHRLSHNVTSATEEDQACQTHE